MVWCPSFSALKTKLLCGVCLRSCCNNDLAATFLHRKQLTVHYCHVVELVIVLAVVNRSLLFRKLPNF